MTDQTIVAIARSLAAALSQAGYSRNPDDKREVMRLQTELCAAVRQEEQHAADTESAHVSNEICPEQRST
jgi:hypothetical protein